MKTPPFLLLAALLFWGWQSNLLLAGALMGVVLEGARFITARWDLAEEDFRRILTFCSLLTLALLIYVITANQEGGGLTRMLNANPVAVVRSTSIAATTFLRWLPMTVFLFVAAQLFSERGSVPLSAISVLFRRQRRKKTGAPAERDVNVTYPYFMVCLFSAGIHHTNEGTQTYFWGICVLIAWALWPLRPRRSGVLAWLCAFGVVVVLGYSGVRGVGLLAHAAENFNAQWMARFFMRRTDSTQTLTAIGQIGYLKLSPRIVIRLKPKDGSLPPEYLREASYRFYGSTTWRAGVAGKEFDYRQPNSGGTTYLLVPGKTNVHSVVNIACYLDGYSREVGAPEGLLPLPTGCSQLENTPSSLAQIKINKTGAVLAAGPGLMIFDARFGPGPTFDSPPETAGTDPADLTVPTNEIPALLQVIPELQISGTNEEEELQAVRQFFAGKFSYSVWLGPDKTARTNETPLARFLLHSRSGHCEYFATATVLLLRELGIPARYAVGYAVHEKSGKGYVVRERDAHAWCLVWNEQTKTWQDFDTTPSSWIAEENKRAPATQWLSDVWSWIRFQIARFRYGQTNLRAYILWALVPVMALLLYQIIFRSRKQRRAKSKAGTEEKLFRQGLDSEFYLLENRLAARGVPRQTGELLPDWLSRALAEPALAELREPLQKLLHLHYRHRFDPRGLSADERENLKREAKRCLDVLLQTKS